MIPFPTFTPSEAGMVVWRLKEPCNVCSYHLPGHSGDQADHFSFLAHESIFVHEILHMPSNPPCLWAFHVLRILNPSLLQRLVFPRAPILSFPRSGFPGCTVLTDLSGIWSLGILSQFWFFLLTKIYFLLQLVICLWFFSHLSNQNFLCPNYRTWPLILRTNQHSHNY